MFLLFSHRPLAQTEMGSPRNLKAVNRQLLLTSRGEVTCESKTSIAVTHFTASMANLGLFGGESDLEASLNSVRECIRYYIEAGELSDNESIRNAYTRLCPTMFWGFHCAMASSSEKFDPYLFSQSEEGLVEGKEL